MMHILDFGFLLGSFQVVSPWLLIGSRNASLPLPKCVYLVNSKRAHHGHFGILPHNSPLPQISFTDWLIMAAHDMTDALKHPRRGVPSATIGDDTITALAQLAAIFKNKFKKPLAPEITESPIKAAENKRPAALIQQVLTYPVKHNYQTRLQTQVNTISPANIIEYQHSPQLPRVVALAARSTSPLRVPARARNLSPRNFSHEDLVDMVSTNQTISLGGNTGLTCQ
jgi:hypothetical protein